jgi:hypothetical protein
VEKKSLAQLESREDIDPPSRGPAIIEENKGVPYPTVHGGNPLAQGPAHPNLLRGRDRHFGAKMADPGVAFREAVEEAVRERLNPTEPQLFDETTTAEPEGGPPPSGGPREARRRRGSGRRRPA